MEYMEGMEVIDSTLLDEVISAMDAYDYDKYTDKDVENALSHDVLTTEDFAALLSPAALNHLEEMAQRAQIETRKHFGNSVSMYICLHQSISQTTVKTTAFTAVLTAITKFAEQNFRKKKLKRKCRKSRKQAYRKFYF